MVSPISILDSQAKETNVQLFTKPLRGVLGGRKVIVGTADKGEKILKVWQRVLLGALLFTAGLPYTLFAGAILLCSKPQRSSKIVPSPNKPDDLSIPSHKAPTLEDRLSIDALKALISFFAGAKIEKKDIQICEILVFYSGEEDYAEKCRQFNQPTLIKLAENNTCEDVLIVPLEYLGKDGKWERDFLNVHLHQFYNAHADSWSVRINQCEDRIWLPLNAQANHNEVLPYNALMSGKIVSFEGKQYRLLSDLNKADIEEKLTPEIIRPLANLFQGTKIQLNEIKVSEEIIFNENISPEDVFQELRKLNQPTLKTVKFPKVSFEALIIPLEYKEKDQAEWARNVSVLAYNKELIGSPWAVDINKELLFKLPLEEAPESDKINAFIDLMSGKILSLGEIEYRLPDL